MMKKSKPAKGKKMMSKTTKTKSKGKKMMGEY